MIKEILKELIKEQQDYDLFFYVQINTISMQIIHIENATEDFIKVVLSNGNTVVMNSKFIECFTIEISKTRNAQKNFETSVNHLEDLLTSLGDM